MSPARHPRASSAKVELLRDSADAVNEAPGLSESLNGAFGGPKKWVRLNRSISRRARAGYSLIEILVVLAIIALATAVIMPNGARLLDQAVAQSVFFELQRDLLELRREANRTQSAILLRSASEREADAPGRVLTMRPGWSYDFAPSLEIDEAGSCSPSEIILSGDTGVVLNLRVSGRDCRLIRYLPAAAGRR